MKFLNTKDIRNLVKNNVKIPCPRKFLNLKKKS